MENLKLAVETFRSSHTDFLSTNDYSLGYGLDPARKGVVGIIVFAMSDDDGERVALFTRAKETLPTKWEGHPVYVKGTARPWTPTSK